MIRAIVRRVRRDYRKIQAFSLGRLPAWRRIDQKFYMYIDPVDWMDRAFYFRWYERQLIELIHAAVNPGDVCLDVGAQKGFVTLHMANAVGPKGRVLAFEPDPRAMASLRRNVEYNNLQNVSLHTCAAADENADCEFALSSQIGWSSRYPNDTAKPTITGRLFVSTRRLDDFLGEISRPGAEGRVSFIKIDVEGSELLVLKGASKILEHHSPVIYMEINKPSLRAGGFTTDSIQSLLGSHGYRMYSVAHPRRSCLQRRALLMPISSLSSDIGEQQDIVATHPHAGFRGLASCIHSRET